MAIREVYSQSKPSERWTNESTPGYTKFGADGVTVASSRALTTAEAADLTAMDTQKTQQTNATTISDYLVQRRARLTAIRTQAQAVSAKVAIASGLTTANLNTQVIALQTDLKTLAAAIDDLAQYDIRAGRAILGQYDGTD
jgi:hypothetical protein